MTKSAQRSLGPQTTQVIELLDRRMTVDIYDGPGDPVLLLHGVPGWRGTWETVARRLAAEYRVIVPDLLGFGGSDEPGHDFHAQGQATAVEALLERLAIPSAHVVGFDFGGPVAVAMYARAPKRFKTLALIATNLFTDTPIPGPLKLAPVPIVGRALFHLAFGRPGLIVMWFAATRQRGRFPLRRFWRSIAPANAVRWTRRIFFESMRDLAGRYGLVQRTLAEVRVPTLVVWGDNDPFFPVPQGERLARALSAARFIVLRDTGHFVPEEQPEALLASLRDHFTATASHGSTTALDRPKTTFVRS